MKEVRRGLFIGDSKDAEAVLSSSSNHAVTHLLSLLSSLPSSSHHTPPSQHAPQEGLQWQAQQHLTCFWLPWNDTEDQNILDTLQLCLDFINQGLQKGCVLVHCLAGVSRSAAVVTAFLMKSECLTLEGALSSLKSVSMSACPNNGFLGQLKLFESMGFIVDRKSHIYKKFHAEKLGELYGQGKCIESSCFAADPALVTSAGPQDSELQRRTDLNLAPFYRCKKCRRIVACQENVLTHEQESGNLPVRKKEKGSLWNETRSVDCTSVFVEPMQWMMAVQEGGVLGKLSCASCNARLGSFNWAGVQCSCGTWVVPAFQLHKSRLDASNF
eukprot:c20516_g1_i1 orf=399-1382(-)